MGRGRGSRSSSKNSSSGNNSSYSHSTTSYKSKPKSESEPSQSGLASNITAVAAGALLGSILTNQGQNKNCQVTHSYDNNVTSNDFIENKISDNCNMAYKEMVKCVEENGENNCEHLIKELLRCQLKETW